MATYEVTRIHSSEKKEILMETFTNKAAAQAYCKREVKALRPYEIINQPKNDLFCAKFSNLYLSYVVTYHIVKVS